MFYIRAMPFFACFSRLMYHGLGLALALFMYEQCYNYNLLIYNWFVAKPLTWKMMINLHFRLQFCEEKKFSKQTFIHSSLRKLVGKVESHGFLTLIIQNLDFKGQLGGSHFALTKHHWDCYWPALKGNTGRVTRARIRRRQFRKHHRSSSSATSTGTGLAWDGAERRSSEAEKTTMLLHWHSIRASTCFLMAAQATLKCAHCKTLHNFSCMTCFGIDYYHVCGHRNNVHLWPSFCVELR